jgi:hypothetical protein
MSASPFADQTRERCTRVEVSVHVRGGCLVHDATLTEAGHQWTWSTALTSSCAIHIRNENTAVANARTTGRQLEPTMSAALLGWLVGGLVGVVSVTR